MQKHRKYIITQVNPKNPKDNHPSDSRFVLTVPREPQMDRLAWLPKKQFQLIVNLKRKRWYLCWMDSTSRNSTPSKFNRVESTCFSWTYGGNWNWSCRITTRSEVDRQTATRFVDRWCLALFSFSWFPNWTTHLLHFWLCLVYAPHGHKLMGCKSPVGEPIHDSEYTKVGNNYEPTARANPWGAVWRKPKCKVASWRIEIA